MRASIDRQDAGGNARARMLMLALFSLLSSTGLVSAQAAPQQLEPVGQIGGASHALIIDPPKLGASFSVYAGAGPRVLWMTGELPSPELEMRDSSQPLPGMVRGLALAEDALLVAAGRGGLQVLASLEPGLPLQAQLEFPGEVLDVSARGQMAVLARGDMGLDLVDVEDPRSPLPLGHIDLPAGAQAMDLAVAGDIVLSAAGVTGLHVIDIADPAAPQEISRFDRVDGFPAFVETVAVMADRAGGPPTLAFAGDGPRIHAIDLSSPMSPTLRSTVELAGRTVRALAVEENRLGIVTVDQLDASGQLTVYRFDDPDKPSLEGSFELDTGGIPAGIFETPRPRLDLAWVGANAFVAVGARGRRLVQTWDARAPSPADSWDRMAWPEAVRVDGRRVLAATGPGGLELLEIDGAEQLQPVLRLDTPGYARDLDARGSDVFVADENGGLRRFVVPEADEPPGSGPAREIDALESLTAVAKLALAERHIYVADGLAGLRIVAIDEADGMRDVGGIDLGFDFVEGLRVDLEHKWLLVARGSGVSLFDITDEATPELKWTEETPGYAYDVEVLDVPGFDDAVSLLVADGEAGMTEIMLDASAVPTFTHTADTVGTARAIALGKMPDWLRGRQNSLADDASAHAVSNDDVLHPWLAYIADGEGGMSVFDLFVDWGPDEWPGFYLPREAIDVAADGGRVLLAAHGSGLWLFHEADRRPRDRYLHLPWLIRGVSPDGRTGR